MIAAKMGDPVLGIDIHAVIPPPPVPPPGPPTPLPHPFVGVVFDPLGAAIGAAMGAIFGGGGPVFVNGMPTGNTGTAVKGQPHIPTPPGVGPHPSDCPTGNEGTLITGSKTVHFAGASESRTFSHVISCNFPINLPTSVCMAVPMGAPVLVGGPEAIDWVAAATSAIRTKWLSGKLHDLLGAKPGSWRSKVICFLTGHPVDVMTGELIAEATDFEIAGLIPIVWERNYRSRQTRDGALGPAWSHPFDELVEETETGVKLWLADGRPKQHKRLARGESEWEPEDRYTLERTELGYETKTWDGMRRVYRKVEGAKHFVLTEIRDRARNAIKLSYLRGYLVRIDDTAGRALEVAWTKSGRMEGVYFEKKPLVRYTYDAENRLAAAIDPLGHALRYEYRGGVMVKETHKGGLVFRFAWDWENPEGWCVRTWGENPKAATQPGQPEGVPRHIYDRRIRYVPEKHFTSVEDGRGGVTQYWGNALGLVEKEMNPLGAVREYTWSDDCRKLSETDGEGHKTEWVYDVWGNCVLERDALGNETRRAFDAENQLVGMTDAAGGSWEVSWDSHGRPAAVKNPLGVATRYTHDEHGRLIGIDDPMGRAVRAAWTPRHDLASVRAGERQETTFEHDSLGRVVGSRDAIGRVSRATRDAMGRITYLERADGERLTMVHDAEGNIIEQTDSLGRTVKMAYAGMNRLIEHIDPMRFRVRLVYDGEEDLIAVENQIGERYRFELDLAGRVRDELGFDGKKHSYTYDKAGRTSRIVGPDYAVTAIERDPLGRVVKRALTAPPGPYAPSMQLGRKEEEAYEYDARGDLIATRTSGASVVFERDALGRIVREHATGAYGDATKTIDSRYDHSGFRIERETSHGHRTQYGYDAAGELTDIRAGVSASLQSPELRALNIPALSLPDFEIKISRDPMGLELARRMPGGVVAIWKRDQFGRPATREVLTGAFPGQQPKDVARVGYQWQGADQIAALIDAQNGATRYEYDPRGHLIKALFPDGTTQYRTSDAVSNLFKTPDMSDRKYGRGGRLERANGNEYRYDGHGNLVEKVLSDGASWKYLWTPSGRLAEVVRPDGKRVTFAYDALGRRVRKEFDGTVTEFVWDGDDLVHERVSKAGDVQPLVTWLFEPGSFAPVAKFEGRNRFSVVTDHLGAPSMLMTEAGDLAWKSQLDMYGVAHTLVYNISENGATGTPWRHPGQYADAETGLYYNRFRYYDPQGGRYISTDPVRIRGGFALYSYVANSLSWVDPFGLKACNISSEAKEALGEAPADMLRPHMHHVVMEGAFSHWGEEKRAFVTGAQDILEKHGIDIQGKLNIVWAENAGHSAEYAEKVFNTLQKADTKGKQAVERALDRMGEQITKGTFL